MNRSKSNQVRLTEIEPYINKIKEIVVILKPLVPDDAWYSEIKPTAEKLISEIVTAYLDKNLPPYEVIDVEPKLTSDQAADEGADEAVEAGVESLFG